MRWRDFWVRRSRSVFAWIPVVLGAPLRNESGPCLVLQREHVSFGKSFGRLEGLFMNGTEKDLRRSGVDLAGRRLRKSCSR